MNKIIVKNKLQKNKIEMDTYSRKITYFHWIGMIACIVLYLIFIYLIATLATQGTDLWVTINGKVVTKNSLVGILAQSQVMLIIFLVLNPIKGTNQIAILLNVILATGAIAGAVFGGNMDALPGIVIPSSTIFMVVIISRYGKNLSEQINIVKKKEKLLHHMAFYDSLTELPNRAMILEQMGKLTDLGTSKSNNFAFVFLDLDNFKKINDSMGHSIGDNILKQVTLRWMEQVHKDDILGRLGGDEFGLLICRKLSDEEVREYLQGFRSALLKPFIIDYKEFFISASFGITRYPEDGNNTTELLKNADIALYQAKNSGKNDIQFFRMDMQGEVLKKIQLENGLLSSIRNNELYMVFQPLYTCDNKTLRGYEALARWRNPELGLISPAQFIPIAEETGIIVEMGKWIFRTVLQKFMEFQKEFNITTIVSINISVVQMIDPSFVSMIKEVLEETGFDSRYLELEITESVYIAYPDLIIEVIKQLKEVGIRIALDDFGTGYASLSYLHILPINVLKIDKSFIDKVTPHSAMSQIVSNIISLSHQLGIEVVAEGVELEEQLEYLKSHNCDYIQGYLLSKPINEEQLVRDLRSSQQKMGS